MRYFYTGNASRPIKIAGQGIQFERLRLSGGAWKGVYATENEEIADTLATMEKEISQQEYEGLKKNKRGINPNFLKSNEKPVEPEQARKPPAVESNLSEDLPTVDEAVNVKQVEESEDPLE